MPGWKSAPLLLLLLLHTQSPQTLAVREVLRLGGDAVDPNVTFGHIQQLALSARNELVVLDSKEQKVTMFDSAGRFLRSFGRRGSGPGEFQFVSGLQVDSLMTVFDVMQERSSTFDLSGKHRDTKPFALRGLHLVRIATSGGNLIGATATVFTRARPADQEGMIAVVVARAGQVDTIATYRGGAAVWFASDQQTPWGAFPAPTGDAGAWHVYADTLVLADGINGTLRWYSLSGQPRVARQANLGLVAREVNAQDRTAALALLRRDQKNLPARVEIEMPPRWSVATAIVRSPDGALWVRNGQTGTAGNTYTEITTDGRSTRWLLPNGFELHAVRGRRLYGTQPAEFGSPTVVVYQRT